MSSSTPTSSSSSSSSSSPSSSTTPLGHLRTFTSHVSLSAPTDLDRLSMPTPTRILTASALGLATGLFLGGTQGARTSALRFRAENTHRLPTSTKGWYLYHKSKNYTMMLHGLRQGIFLGLKLGLWVGAFYWAEAAVDGLRGERRDVASTVVAGLGVAGAFSAWERMGVVGAARNAQMGLVGGLVYGFGQDGLSLLRGRRLRYVDFLVGRGQMEEEKVMD